MTIVYAVLLILGVIPLGAAWRANRTTSLRDAVFWSMAAWLVWAWALIDGDPNFLGLEPIRYCALCLTGAMGVAVLGARRPYVFAWNFVVLGLLSVMLLPLIESLVIGTHPVDTLRIAFLGATLAVGLINYLPTRSTPAVLLLAAVLAGETMSLFAPEVWPDRGEIQLCHLILLLAPWAVLGCWWRRAPAPSEFDRRWLDFRDRYGLFWAQRVRDQFNRAAEHAGWPVHLTWRGLHRSRVPEPIDPAQQQVMVEMLQKTLQRFVGPPSGSADSA